LQAVDLDHLSGRQAAEQQLAKYLDSAQVRHYLLQNLVKSPSGWMWRLNLPVLQSSIDALVGFAVPAGASFPGDALFIYGGNSDYVQAAYMPAIRANFPFARLRAMAGAGHWVYADQPAAFVQAVESFLHA
jgi:esterase